MSINGDFTDSVDELTSEALFSRVPFYIEHDLQSPEYIKKMIDLLRIEKEKLINLRTLLIMYEYNLQFYELLILLFKTLSKSTSVSQMLQHTPNMLVEPVVALLKGKKILLSNIFVRKTINYGINKSIEFFIQKRKIKQMLVKRVRQVQENCRMTLNLANQQGKILDANKQHITQEDVAKIKNRMDAAVALVVDELDKVSLEVCANLKIIDSLKEHFVSSVSDILACEDVLNCNNICSLIQKSFGISNIGMIPIKMFVKDLILKKNITRAKVVFLFYALRNCLKNVSSEIDKDFVEINDYSGSDNVKCIEDDVYERMVLNFKPCLEHVIPTKNISSICEEIKKILELQFNLINKEIEYFFDKIFTCEGKNYCKIKKKLVECIYSEKVESSYSSVQKDYDLDECLSANEEIESRILNLCSHRDVVLKRICKIKELCTSSAKYPYVLINFFLNDSPDDLLKQSSCFRSTYKSVNSSMKSRKPLDSNVVVILKKDIDFINNEVLTLEKNLNTLITQRSYIYSSSTTLSPDSVTCFCVKSRY